MVDARLTVANSVRIALRAAETPPAALNIGNVTYDGGPPEYDGAYEATPSRHEQVFETAGKTMRDDFTVVEIPYYTTTNVSGGYTAIISEG